MTHTRLNLHYLCQLPFHPKRLSSFERDSKETTQKQTIYWYIHWIQQHLETSRLQLKRG